jgi:hypothetical protein
VISQQAVEREVRDGQLAALRIPGQQLVRETGWVYLKANRVPRKVDEMIKTLEKTMPKTPAAVSKASA